MKHLILLFAVIFLFPFPGKAATYVVNGTSGSDTIFLGLFGTIFVTRNGSQALSLPSSACNASANTLIQIYAYGGSDDITVAIPDSCNINCQIYGGDGGDVFDVVGCDGIVLQGHGGADVFYLGASSNYFNGEAYGGDGNDEFEDYLLQYAYLSGGNGNDVFSGNVRDYALIYGGNAEDYFFGGTSESEGQGYYVANDDTGSPSGDHFVGLNFYYYNTIYCDSTDTVDFDAIVENVVGPCDD